MIKSNKEYGTELIKQIAEKIKKNKYVFIVLLAGLILLLIPGKEEEEKQKGTVEEKTGFSLSETETRLAAILTQIDGAGDVSVMLATENDGERILAADVDLSEKADGGDSAGEKDQTRSEKTVVISSGSGTEETVTVEYVYPKYIGAVVVAEGADRAKVRLDITEAVAAVTDLPSGKIKVIKKMSP